jgi:hypothetical protein
MKRNQCGFTAVAGLLVLVIVAIIGGTGWYVINANKNTDDTLNKSGLGTTTKSSKKTAETSTSVSQADPTANWTPYSNKEGKYSLKYPSGWVTDSHPDHCEDKTFLLGPTADTAGSCGSDNISQMSFYSFTVESGPQGLSEQYYDNITTDSVIVGGVKGERQSGTYNYSGFGLGPEKGTKTIEYTFKTNGIIYKATYEQQPNFPDAQSPGC